MCIHVYGVVLRCVVGKAINMYSLIIGKSC